MRRLPVTLTATLATAAAAALLLAGCSSSPDPAESSATAAAPTPGTASCADSGSASNSVTVTGDFGAAPTTAFTGPYTIDTTERTIVTKGDGDELAAGDMATVDFTIYNGSTGDKVFSTFDQGSTPLQLTVDESQFIVGVVRAVNCAPVGSRVAAVIPPADGFGTNGNSSLGIGATDSMVMVADIEQLVPSRADGQDQPAQDGLPTVALDDTGKPTITIPQADAPADLQLEVLKKGDGQTVADGDTVTVQYQGVIWRTGEVFDQSWGRGPSSFQTSGVVPGFKQALVGQTVGSQVLVVIPPALGYGDQGNSAAGIQGTDTLVFVVDILAADTPRS